MATGQGILLLLVHLQSTRTIRKQDEESPLAVLRDTASAEPSPACATLLAPACSETAGRHRAGQGERGEDSPAALSTRAHRVEHRAADPPRPEQQTERAVKIQLANVEGHRPPRAAVTELARGSRWGLRVPACKDNQLVFSSLAVTGSTFH